MSDPKPIGLCHRCEHRARHFEDGSQPRCECGGSGAVYSCYMFEPVRPPVLIRCEGDTRPLAAPWCISARAHADGLAEGALHLRDLGSGRVVLYWEPRGRRASGPLVLTVDADVADAIAGAPLPPAADDFEPATVRPKGKRKK